MPQQRRSNSAPKTGGSEMPGLVPSRACQPSRSGFSLVFCETVVKTGYDPLDRPPMECIRYVGLGPTCG